MLFGLLNLSFWGYVLAYVLMAHVTIMAVTLYLHRCQTHRGIDIHPILSHFFRLWLWLTTGMETRAWVAIHRKHHAKCETEDDPHSPQVLGLKKVLLEGAELYRKEARNKETMDRYGFGTPNDWLERNVYSRFSAKGILIMLLVDLLLFGIPGITIWAFQMMTIPFLAAGVINGVGHYFGYRNFECPDAAVNISPIGILMIGEELHNNHHTFGSSAKFSVKWWEFDMGWMYIKIFQWLGLVKVLRTFPKSATTNDKTAICADNLKAILNGRFQIMASYARNVVYPVFDDVKQHAKQGEKRVLRKCKSLLIREQSLVNDKGQHKLSAVLQENDKLNQVYQFRLKLQDIWNRTTASQKELLESLQDWCRQAEASGLDSLKEFADYLRSFTTKSVAS